MQTSLLPGMNRDFPYTFSLLLVLDWMEFRCHTTPTNNTSQSWPLPLVTTIHESSIKLLYIFSKPHTLKHTKNSYTKSVAIEWGTNLLPSVRTTQVNQGSEPCLSRTIGVPETIPHWSSCSIRSMHAKEWTIVSLIHTNCPSDPKEPFLLVLKLCWVVNHSTFIFCTYSNHTCKKTPPLEVRWEMEKTLVIILFIIFHFVRISCPIILKSTYATYSFYSTHIMLDMSAN